MVYKKLINKQRIIKGFWILLGVLFVVLMSLMLNSSFNYETSRTKLSFNNDFNEGWTLCIDNTCDTQIIDLPKYKLDNFEGNILKISRILPLDKLREPSLIIASSQQHIKVYLDNEEIYEYETLKDARGNKTNGSGRIIIDLPEDCYGKTISIEYGTSFKKLSGFISSIYYGERSENTLFLLKVSLNKLILVCILFLMCLICAVFSLRLRKFDKRESRGILSMSINLFLIIVWVVMQSEWLYLLPINFAVNYFIEFAASYSIPVYFYYYIYCMCKVEYDFIIKGLSKFHFLLLVFFTLFQYLGIYDFYSLNIVYLISLLITLTICITILLLNLRKKTFIKKYIIIIFMMIVFTVSEMYIVVNLNLNIAKNTLTASIMIMSINLIYNFFNSYFEMYNSKIENAYLQKHIERQLNHYNRMNEDYEEVRKYRHDMKNHLLCISHLINNNDNKGASLYIKEIDKHLSKKYDIYETGNPILDAILTEKKKSALRMGIDFKDNIILKEDIKMEPIDVCTIFGNALDNAIESCEKISEDYRKIEISMISKNNMLAVKIENSMRGNLIINNNNIITSKFNKKNHGIGITNIKEAIKKYDGIIDISCEENIFKLQLTLFNV